MAETPLKWADDIVTPAFVVDLSTLRRDISRLLSLKEQLNFNVLFSLNASSNFDLLTSIGGVMDGFAVSSLFDAKIASQFVKRPGIVSITAPIYVDSEIADIVGVTDIVNFNSLSQLRRHLEHAVGRAEIGVRINPEISAVSDPRYDPCRPSSKLGVLIPELSKTLNTNPGLLSKLSGLHLHANCEADDFNPLLSAVERLIEHLDPLLRGLRWINLGGGYLFSDGADRRPLEKAVRLLRELYKLTVFVEPGLALARSSGYLVATVIDLFERDGSTLAILDTTVNHAPEVFEYSWRPDLLGHADENPFPVNLVGCSCLAGDIFGEYKLLKPLQIGSRVVFTNMGGYTMVKAHMFNGINLPSLYTITADGQIILRRRYSFDDYMNRISLWETKHESV